MKRSQRETSDRPVSRRATRGSQLSRTAALLTATLASLGCNGSDDELSSAQPSIGSPAAAQIDLGQLHVEGDLRRHDAALTAAFLRGDPAHRLAAAWGLARIGADPVATLLARGLTDPDPTVRVVASFGLSQLGLPIDAWLGAAAAETDPTAAGLMLEDLGRGLDPKRSGILMRALDGDHPQHACVGITHLIERDPALPVAAISSLVRLADHPDPEIARACLQALTQLPPTALQPVAPLILERAAASQSSPEPERQRQWLAVIQTQGAAAVPLFLKATASPHPAVAAEALEGLAQARGVSLPTWTAVLEPRLGRVLDRTGTVADPPVLRAGLAVTPRLGDSAELVDWLGSVVERLAKASTETPTTDLAGLHCAAAQALDRVRKWPARTLDCGRPVVPAWVGQTAAAEVLGHAEGSDALRATQLRRLFDQGDWHVKQAVMAALHSVEAALALPLLIDGVSHDHLEVRAAAMETIALLAPRLRTTSQPLPFELSAPLRQAFQVFHVQSHVRGLRAFLSVTRMARLRAELGPVTVLARSGIAPVRDDARRLLDEWGHPQLDQAPDPVPDPISRDALVTAPVRVSLNARGQAMAFTFDPQLAPVTVARLIHWFQQRPALEVTDARPGRHVVIGPNTGIAPGPWRSEESRAAIRRGAIVIQPRERDGIQASLLILLVDAPELEGRVTVVGQVTEGLPVLDSLMLAETLVLTSR